MRRMGSLPEPIAEHFRRSVANPPATARGTLLRQVGEMRLGPNKPWLPFSATQIVRAVDVEFVWRARFRMAPFVVVRVEDAIVGGRGRLDARLWNIVPVARARGPAVDRAEAQRYLAELAWCPMGIVCNDHLRFERRSRRSVRVSTRDSRTWVDLEFDTSGDIVGARTDARPRERQDQPWEGRFRDYRDFGGIRAPSRGRVWWETPDGPFEYWRGRIIGLTWA